MLDIHHHPSTAMSTATVQAPNWLAAAARRVRLAAMPTLLSMVWAAATPASAQDLDSIRSGTLLFEVADGDALEVPRISTDVRIDAIGEIAHVEVRQRFHNPSDLWAAAIYAFPLPRNAMLDHLRTEMNQIDVGQLYERVRSARQEPESASQQPLLLQTPLADIAPHAAIEVTISYLQIIDHLAAAYRLRVPLAANSRDLAAAPVSYLPVSQAAAGVPSRDCKQPHRVSVRVSINPGGAVSGVTSLHHAIRVSGTDRIVVTSRTSTFAPERDFELAWIPQAAQRLKLRT
jgi:Ca-activated chloride channel homolog